MAAILLFGVAASTDWLPLFIPLMAVVAIGWAVRGIVYLVRKRKQRREEEVLSAHLEGDAGGHEV